MRLETERRCRAKDIAPRWPGQAQIKSLRPFLLGGVYACLDLGIKLCIDGIFDLSGLLGEKEKAVSL
jgi:hypothetical protein